jgi:hypothetical protein
MRWLQATASSRDGPATFARSAAAANRLAGRQFQGNTNRASHTPLALPPSYRSFRDPKSSWLETEPPRPASPLPDRPLCIDQAASLCVLGGDGVGRRLTSSRAVRRRGRQGCRGSHSARSGGRCGVPVPVHVRSHWSNHPEPTSPAATSAPTWQSACPRAGAGQVIASTQTRAPLARSAFHRP